jgi:hypothetical protein
VPFVSIVVQPILRLNARVKKAAPGKSGFEWSCVTVASGCGRKHPSHRGEEWLVNVASHSVPFQSLVFATGNTKATMVPVRIFFSSGNGYFYLISSPVLSCVNPA